MYSIDGGRVDGWHVALVTDAGSPSVLAGHPGGGGGAAAPPPPPRCAPAPVACLRRYVARFGAGPMRRIDGLIDGPLDGWKPAIGSRFASPDHLAVRDVDPPAAEVDSFPANATHTELLVRFHERGQHRARSREMVEMVFDDDGVSAFPRDSEPRDAMGSFVAVGSGAKTRGCGDDGRNKLPVPCLPIDALLPRCPLDRRFMVVQRQLEWLWHTFRAVSSPAILLVPPLDTALPGGCNALDHLAPPPARAACT